MKRITSLPLAMQRRTLLASPSNRCRRIRQKQAHRLACGVMAMAITGTSVSSGLWAAVASPTPSAMPNIQWTSDLPLADPVVTADSFIAANRTTAWTQQNVRYLLLEGDVTVRIGSYGFVGQKAVVRIDTDTPPGKTIRHLCILFDEAHPLKWGAKEGDTQAKGAGAVWAQGKNLLITGATQGQVELSTNRLKQADIAPDDALVQQAANRFSKYLLAIARPTNDPATPAEAPVETPEHRQAKLQRRTEIADQRWQKVLAEYPQLAPPPPDSSPTSPSSPATTASPTPDESSAESLAEKPRDEGILGQGLLMLGADRPGMMLQPDPVTGEKAIALIGNVRLLFQSHDGQRTVSLQAENAVVFIDGDVDPAQTSGLDASKVKGIYLEDNVIASYGDMTVRAPRVYFDLAQNKAVLLDAVLYTYDFNQQIPIYLRASMLRQESRTSFTAQKALLTSSEFGQPHFAIAAERLTISQRPDTSGDGSTLGQFAATDMSIQIGGYNLVTLPKAEGEADKVAIRAANVGWGQGGPLVETRWDALAMIGESTPKGIDLESRYDYRGIHGPAGGVKLEYNRPEMFGLFDTYAMPYDQGDDRLGDRNDVDHDGDSRGYAKLQHRQYLPEHWELSLEAAYVSDPTFLEQFFRDKAEADKQYETSLYLKNQQDDWAFTFLTQYDLQNFVTQTTTLQSPGYVVDRLPELGYYRLGTSLWDDRLTYFSQTTLSQVRIRPGKITPDDMGFTQLQSQTYFGQPALTSYRDAAELNGIPTDWRSRIDTRHEINAPMKLSIVDVTPYAAGRITAYDEDFEAYRGEEDKARFTGTVGVRTHTQFSRTLGDVDNRLFDLHGMRHLIEPSADVFEAATTINPGDLPIYDPDVESAAKGFGTRLGLRNTLQTQRGGPGRWRSVDWVVVDTDYVHRDDQGIDENEPIARYYSYRPEYTLGGDHFFGKALWAITDTLASTTELTHDLERDRTAQWRTGITYQASPTLKLNLWYGEIQPLSSRLINAGFVYQFTRIYSLGFNYAYDLDEQETRTLAANLERKLPGWRLIFQGQYDATNSEVFVGFQLIPLGQNQPSSLMPMPATSLMQ